MSEADAPNPTARWVGLVEAAVLAAVTCWGAWIRWVAWPRGFHSDELGTSQPGDFWAVLYDPEIGVNPPLFRLLFEPWLPEWEALRQGRAWSFVLSVLAIPLTAWLARRMSGGDRVAGVLAAALFAAHPIAVRLGVTYRAYTTTYVVIVLHLVCALAWAEAEGPVRRRWGIAAAGTAVLLPWLHYFTVPLLLVLGVAGLLVWRSWHWIALYVPAALGSVWLGTWVLSEPARRVAQQEAVSRTFVKLGGTALAPSEPLTYGLSKAAGALGLGPVAGLTWQGIGTTLLLLAVLATWRWLRPGQRWVALGWAGCLVTILALTRVQYVRVSTVMFLLAFLGPTLAAWPTIVRSPVGRGVGWLVVAALYAGGLPRDLRIELGEVWRRDAMPEFVDAMPELVADRELDVIWIAPTHAVGRVWFHATHVHPGLTRHEAPCDGDEACYPLGDDLALWGTDVVPPGGGVVVCFERQCPAELDTACVADDVGPHRRQWTCPDGGVEDGPSTVPPP